MRVDAYWGNESSDDYERVRERNAEAQRNRRETGPLDGCLFGFAIAAVTTAAVSVAALLLAAVMS